MASSIIFVELIPPRWKRSLQQVLKKKEENKRERKRKEKKRKRKGKEKKLPQSGGTCNDLCAFCKGETRRDPLCCVRTAEACFDRLIRFSF